jgi:hypothetical protein
LKVAKDINDAFNVASRNTKYEVVVILNLSLDTDLSNFLEKALVVSKKEEKIFLKMSETLYLGFGVQSAELADWLLPPFEEALQSICGVFTEELEAKLEEVKDKKETYREKLNAAVAEYAKYAKQLMSLRTTFAQELASDLDLLKNNSLVESVSIRNSYVYFTTKDVWLADCRVSSKIPSKSKKRYIGKFSVRISGSRSIDVQNLCWNSSLKQIHPHAHRTAFCLGSYDEAFTQALVEWNWQVLSLTVLEFLFSMEYEDAVSVGRLKEFPFLPPNNPETSTFIPLLEF